MLRSDVHSSLILVDGQAEVSQSDGEACVSIFFLQQFSGFDMDNKPVLKIIISNWSCILSRHVLTTPYM